MRITLNLTANIYGAPDETGYQKVVKRNVRYKKTFESNLINVSNYITSKGDISKTMCLVIENDKEYICKHRFEDIEKLINPVKVRGLI